MRTALLIGVLGLLAGCDVLSWFQPPVVYVQTATLEGVIFSAEEAASQRIGRYGTEPDGGYWTPSRADVLDLEAGLADFLTENQFEFVRNPIADDLPGYRRQYVGFVLDGRWVIYASFFCEWFDDPHWRTRFFQILDGGDCFFQLLYDVEARRYFDLMVNGEA